MNSAVPGHRQYYYYSSNKVFILLYITNQYSTSSGFDLEELAIRKPLTIGGTL